MVALAALNMSKKCGKCEKTVYPTEELKCLDKVWHKWCFKCEECGMTLNMRNYKGFDKKPYCDAHIPKAKATTVAETPELRRIAENTKLQSNVKYHAEFEKAKGKFTQVADDPETLRIRQNSKIISNVIYHGEYERKAAMEQKRSLKDEDAGRALNSLLTRYYQLKKASQTDTTRRQSRQEEINKLNALITSQMNRSNLHSNLHYKATNSTTGNKPSGYDLPFSAEEATLLQKKVVLSKLMDEVFVNGDIDKLNRAFPQKEIAAQGGKVFKLVQNLMRNGDNQNPKELLKAVKKYCKDNKIKSNLKGPRKSNATVPGKLRKSSFHLMEEGVVDSCVQSVTGRLLKFLGGGIRNEFDEEDEEMEEEEDNETVEAKTELADLLDSCFRDLTSNVVKIVEEDEEAVIDKVLTELDPVEFQVIEEEVGMDIDTLMDCLGEMGMFSNNSTAEDEEPEEDNNTSAGLFLGDCFVESSMGPFMQMMTGAR